MNIIILTAKFGYGHISVAESIKEKLLKENKDNNVIIIDFISYLFPRLNKYIYGTFNFLVNKCSKIYNILNLIAPKKTSVPLKKVLVKKIEKLIKDNNIETIISVVPICSSYISAYKKINNDNIPLNTVITDVDVHDLWINSNTDFYYVSSKKTKMQLINKNINKEKIKITGIPVKDKFQIKNKKITRKNILIMGGGLGLIPNIDMFLNKLEENQNLNTTVIVGNNKKLYRKLNKKYQNIKILKFTENVHEYMKNSDLIITKAGGITLFEAIKSKTPLYIIKPFLMQEIGNAKYIEDENIGKIIWKKDKNIINKIIELLNNEIELETMKINMQKIEKNLNEKLLLNIIKGSTDTKCL